MNIRTKALLDLYNYPAAGSLPRTTYYRPLSSSPPVPVLHIPHSSIYALGASASSQPLLHDVSWTIQPGEAWAVLASPSNKKIALLQALTGHLRIAPPPPGGLFPFLRSHAAVSSVSFAHRPRTAGGGFYDFTARYGAVREEDKQTLRESFFPETAKPVHSLAIPEMSSNAQPHGANHESDRGDERQALFDNLIKRLQLSHLLDLPLVAISNGERRRARIVKALLGKPQLLILDEPLTGLDVATRALLLDLLQSIHGSPHIIFGMRPQDPLPEWTTHVALVHQDGTVQTGRKADIWTSTMRHHWSSASSHAVQRATTRPEGEELVSLDNISVTYGDRKVLQNISWTIHANSRWHLQGSNGAGKTTLLALLTGDHPHSYALSHALRLFQRPRTRWPTPHLAARIGRVSPELFNAFPRRPGMSVWDVVGTGFEGAFVPRGRRRVGLGADGCELAEDGEEERWRVARMWRVLRGLRPSAGASGDAGEEADALREFSGREFVDLAAGEQMMVLLMRALVGRPRLVLLDEAWSGMDEGMVRTAQWFLREGGGLEDGQACVVVSHWEEEVPWGREDGVRRFRLDGGRGVEVENDSTRIEDRSKI